MAKAVAKTDKAPTRRRSVKKKESASAGNSEADSPKNGTAENNDEAVKNNKTEAESTHAKYERIKKGSLYLTDLQKLTVSELHDIAKKENIRIEFDSLSERK